MALGSSASGREIGSVPPLRPAAIVVRAHGIADQAQRKEGVRRTPAALSVGYDRLVSRDTGGGVELLQLIGRPKNRQLPGDETATPIDVDGVRDVAAALRARLRSGILVVRARVNHHKAVVADPGQELRHGADTV